MNTSRIVSVDGPAVICSLAIYFPAPGLRGAVFCAFPGAVHRSLALSLKGAGLGFVADLAVCFVWLLFGPMWDPRKGYSMLLNHYLPPSNFIQTHVGAQIPIAMQFGLGLVLWAAVMFEVWIRLWPSRLSAATRFVVRGVGAVTVASSAALLWIVTPLGDYWSYGAAPDGDLPPGPLLGVFLASMPCCALLVALTMHFGSRPSASCKQTDE